MSNQAKDWQRGTYFIRVKDNVVEASVMRRVEQDNYDSLKKYSATARCDPEDQFNLSMGAALAMDRLNKQLEEEKQALKVGDIVKIVEGDLSYINYYQWVVDNIKDPQLLVKYAYNAIPTSNRNKEYRVITIAPWKPGCKTNLAYIQNLDWPETCYLINVDGLEKV